MSLRTLGYSFAAWGALTALAALMLISCAVVFLVRSWRVARGQRVPEILPVRRLRR